MNENISIQTHRTAVLSMDLQHDAISILPNGKESLLKKAAAVLEKARAISIPVIHIIVSFREGYPEISSVNKTFNMVKERGMFQQGSEGAEIHP
jgi:nicotinamidase-related amidase